MKIAIFYISVGGAHQAVARALAEELRRLDSRHELVVADALDYTNTVFKDVYSGGYSSLIHYAPALWKRLYTMTDTERQDAIRSKMVALFSRLNSQRFIRFLKEFRPDRIISTHFFPAEILSMQRGSAVKKIPHTMVLTDYDMHTLWIRPSVHRYCVASDMVKWSLVQKMKVNPDIVSVTGIPVHPKFRDDVSARRITESLRLRSDTPTLLVMSGGLGLGNMPEVMDALLTLPRELNIIAVCGKNDQLKRRMLRKKYPKNVVARILGFTENMHELLSVSDMIITKAGGSTVTEAIVKQCPLMIVSPIPGQEEINTDYVQEQGVGWKADDCVQLRYKVDSLLRHPKKLDEMRENCQRIALPSAGKDIVLTALGVEPH